MTPEDFLLAPPPSQSRPASLHGNPKPSPRVLRTGVCPCGCGGDKGFAPLFAKDADGKATYRTNPESGEPLSRIVIICNNDLDAVRLDLAWRTAHARWKYDRKMAKG